MQIWYSAKNVMRENTYK